jgi:glycosyltransferase involved in cell wall biosynthesis
LRAVWGLSDAFVVGYSGNLGRAHETDTLIEAMVMMEEMAGTGATPVRWLFIGGGALLEPLKAETARRALTSVQFRPYQPGALLAQSLSAADVHLVSLRPELEGFIVPSKFYGVCAAGRPTIFIGDENGEIAHLIAQHRCGRAVAMGDGRGLARAILDLAADPAACRAMGARARCACLAGFDKEPATLRWEQLLLEVTGATGPGAQDATMLPCGPALSSKNAQ